MKNIPTSFLAFLFILLPSCTPTPSEATRIQQAVSGTLTAIPSRTPQPPLTAPTTLPSATLRGLFCEYQFCIGHPPDLAFFDVSAQQNPTAPSSYDQGTLVAYGTNLFIQVMWQVGAVGADPKVILDLILDDEADSPNGDIQVRLLGEYNVFYLEITTSATPVLPYGNVASWACGDRVFAWKAYTSRPGMSETLFSESLEKFRCSE